MFEPVNDNYPVFDEVMGEWVMLDLAGVEHFSHNRTVCRGKVAEANAVVAKHTALNAVLRVG